MGILSNGVSNFFPGRFSVHHFILVLHSSLFDVMLPLSEVLDFDAQTICLQFGTCLTSAVLFCLVGTCTFGLGLYKHGWGLILG